jgi:hypothetical protein
VFLTNSRHLFVPVLEAGKSEAWTARWGLGEGPLLTVLTWRKGGERAFWGTFYKGTVLSPVPQLKTQLPPKGPHLLTQSPYGFDFNI